MLLIVRAKHGIHGTCRGGRCGAADVESSRIDACGMLVDMEMCLGLTEVAGFLRGIWLGVWAPLAST